MSQGYSPYNHMTQRWPHAGQESGWEALTAGADDTQSVGRVTHAAVGRGRLSTQPQSAAATQEWPGEFAFGSSQYHFSAQNSTLSPSAGLWESMTTPTKTTTYPYMMGHAAHPYDPATSYSDTSSMASGSTPADQYALYQPSPGFTPSSNLVQAPYSMQAHMQNSYGSIQGYGAASDFAPYLAPSAPMPSPTAPPQRSRNPLGWTAPPSPTPSPPPTPTSGQGAAALRKKQPLSCYECRQRKVQCRRPEDDPEGMCGTCRTRGANPEDCVYPPESKRGHHARIHTRGGVFKTVDPGRPAKAKGKKRAPGSSRPE